MQWQIQDLSDGERVPTSYFGHFPRKLHEIEKKMDPERGGRTSVAYHEIEDGIFFSRF